MAWVNADYPSRATPALRLAGARAFHAELNAAILAEVGSDSHSVSTREIRELITLVREEIKTLQVEVGRASGGATSYFKIGRAR